MITVFTPTYNRKDRLVKLYESLLKQNYNDFEWLIVDDGSEDDTIEYVESIKKTSLIKINYFKQKNSGKHIAFNKGVELANGDVFICVDSDDVLAPFALKTIDNVNNRYKNNSQICGYIFQKGYNINEPLYKHYKSKEFIANYNEYIINGQFKGDKCEVFKTDILKQYKFPVLDKEKFLAEGFLWSEIGSTYDYVFVDKIIYLCEYLKDGLTNQGRKLRINNPLGGMYHAKFYINKNFKLIIREKNALLYMTYAQFAKFDLIELIKESNFKILLSINIIPSIILKKIWQSKYL